MSNPIRYLSVCSGIEAATCAWHPLGWEAVAISEIEKFPAQVVEHHWKIPNWGDMNDFKKWPDSKFDVLVGGTPCQSFSVAGLRQGLEDPRGNLALVYLAIAEHYRPEWLVWENVPGVLSSDGGRDFGAIIGAMVELGYRPAWRVLDAKFFGVPQRRRRVFVVGHLGDWRRAAAVLFEPASLRRDNPPSRSPGEGSTWDVAPSLRASGVGVERAGGIDGDDPVVADKWPADEACTLNTAFGTKQGLEDQHALGGASLFVPDHVGALTAKGPTGLGAPEVDANHYIVSSGQANASITEDEAPALDCLHEAPILGQPIYAQDTADPLTANEQKTYTHEGTTFRTRNIQAFAPETADPLTAGSNPNSNIAGRRREDDVNLAVDPIPFDETQITHPENRSKPEPGDDAPTLQTDARPPTIAFKYGQSEAAGAFMPTEEFSPTLQSQNNGSTSIPAVAFKPSHFTRGKDGAPSETVPPLSADADKGDQDPVVAFTASDLSNKAAWETEHYPTLNAQVPSDSSNIQYGIRKSMIVRRLTPTECERLQGFPDGYTDIPGASDSGRYKALGNSMAVPVMRWIGERIERMSR